MPIYSYNCLACENNFDEFLYGSEDKEKEIQCPKCQSKEVKRAVEGHGYYFIKGNHDISGVPKKFRGGRTE
jgi:putative FmdB family regulatory protein